MPRFTSTAVLTTTVLFTFLSPPAMAQTVNDTGQWNALFAKGNFGQTCDSRIKWWFDGHVRFTDDTNGFNQSIVRPGIGWGLGENSVLWAGHAWIYTSPISGEAYDEHRIWQQWTWSKSISKTKFATRTRFEQRFVETGDDTGLRLRQLFRVQRSLPGCPPLTLVCWDEVFFAMNDTDWGQSSGFDQNRVFVGFGIKRFNSSKWRTEIGYLNQAINQRGPSVRSNHIFGINLFRSP